MKKRITKLKNLLEGNITTLARLPSKERASRIRSLTHLAELARTTVKQAEADGRGEEAGELKKYIDEIETILDSVDDIAEPNDSEEGGMDHSDSAEDDGDHEDDDSTADDSTEDDDEDSEDSDTEEEENTTDEEETSDEDSTDDSSNDEDEDEDADASEDDAGSSENNDDDDDDADSGNSDTDEDDVEDEDDASNSGESDSDDEDDTDTEDDATDSDSSSDDSSEADDDDADSSDTGDSEESESDDESDDSSDDDDGSTSDGSESSDGGEDDDAEEDDADDDDWDTGSPKVKDNKILINPLDNPSSGQELPKDMKKALEDGGLEIESEDEAIIRIISKLKGDARKAALAALFDVGVDAYGEGIKDDFLQESLMLTEAKVFDEYTEDELADLMNATIAEIERLRSDVSTVDDMDTIIAEIESDLSDTKTKIEISAEDRAAIDKSKAKQPSEQAKKAIGRPSSGVIAGDFSKFLASFEMAIEDLADNEEEETVRAYGPFNRRSVEKGFADHNIILKGERKRKVNTGDLPTIDVYLDYSGSFDSSDVDKANKVVASVAELEEAGKIKINLFFFATHLYTTASEARRDGNNGAWKEILDNIKARETKNVVVITDEDEGYSFYSGKVKDYCTVPGYVWYLWKASKTNHLPEHLRGKLGTYEYSLLGGAVKTVSSH